MTTESTLSRRQAMAVIAAFGASAPFLSRLAWAEARTKIVVNRDPGCRCCEGWAEHLQQAGFDTQTIDTGDLPALKERLRVPEDLRACHTAVVEGYVIEGHVPAAAIAKLLALRPNAIGLATPGMPAGSPGMPSDTPDAYEAVLFDSSSRQVFGKFRGTAEISL